MSKAINEQIENRQDIKGLLGEGVVLAGGAIRDFITGEEPKDFDLFFTSSSALDRTRDILQTSERKDQTAYTETYILNGKVIQLVFKKFYDNPESIINDFDFNICRGYFTEGKGFISKEMAVDIISKEVTVHNITKPIDSLRRLGKYVRKNYEVKESYDYIVSLLATHGHLVILNNTFYGDI